MKKELNAIYKFQLIRISQFNIEHCIGKIRDYKKSKPSYFRHTADGYLFDYIVEDLEKVIQHLKELEQDVRKKL